MSDLPSMSNQERTGPPMSFGSVSVGGHQKAPRGSHPTSDGTELSPPHTSPSSSSGKQAQSDLDGSLAWEEAAREEEALPANSDAVTSTKSELPSSAIPSQEKNIFKKQKALFLQSFASFQKKGGLFKGSGQSQKEALIGESEKGEDSGAAVKSGATSPKARVTWAQCVKKHYFLGADNITRFCVLPIIERLAP
ncbi:hypothetical protein NDU88_000511 [Pleurodeles waltl]|uniref:Uncharacterized protein n=1 Tax=Pleurodeles waltl TaxID=8319 RepID=A0AAV7LUU2_PLEWA|nr:hypothetical protein NDU88_000511 [Pleurodeles waltl]